MVYDVSEQEDDLAMCIGRCCWLNDSHLILVRPFRKVAIWNVENNSIQRVPVRSGALPLLSIARNRQHIAISWYTEYFSKSLHPTFQLFSLKKSLFANESSFIFRDLRADCLCYDDKCHRVFFAVNTLADENRLFRVDVNEDTLAFNNIQEIATYEFPSIISLTMSPESNFIGVTAQSDTDVLTDVIRLATGECIVHISEPDSSFLNSGMYSIHDQVIFINDNIVLVFTSSGEFIFHNLDINDQYRTQSRAPDCPLHVDYSSQASLLVTAHSVNTVYLYTVNCRFAQN